MELEKKLIKIILLNGINKNMKIQLETIPKLVTLSKDLEEYVGYLTYSVHPIGT